MGEIGSEFWNVPASGNGSGLFPPHTQWFLSGRSALRSIVRELSDCHTVAMPSWCCDSMVEPFLEAGFQVRFYPVYWDGGLIQEPYTDCDVLFLMDYFGHTGQQCVPRACSSVLIRDLTHSLFSTPCVDADYCFGSLRKWCGVWTGGYAWTRDGRVLSAGEAEDGVYIALRRDAMERKAAYICGGSGGKDYLELFAQAEDRLERTGIAPAAQRDILLAQTLDVAGIQTRRRTNAETLRSAFAEWLLFPEMEETDCPMFVPVLVPDGRRDKLRSGLIRHEIYCPVHWPVSSCHRLDARERVLYENELSLVCDQRYTVENMQRMVNVIHSLWKEE